MIVSVYVPAYIRPNHYGQTPEIYPTRTVETFEAMAENLAEGFILKHKPSEVLFLDKAHGSIQRKVVICYEVNISPVAGKLVKLIGGAHSIFNVKSIDVACQGTHASFDADQLESLNEGLHEWSDL